MNSSTWRSISACLGGAYLDICLRATCRSAAASLPPPPRCTPDDLLERSARQGSVHLCIFARQSGAEDTPRAAAAAGASGNRKAVNYFIRERAMCPHVMLGACEVDDLDTFSYARSLMLLGPVDWFAYYACAAEHGSDKVRAKLKRSILKRIYSVEIPSCSYLVFIQAVAKYEEDLSFVKKLDDKIWMHSTQFALTYIQLRGISGARELIDNTINVNWGTVFEKCWNAGRREISYFIHEAGLLWGLNARDMYHRADEELTDFLLSNYGEYL